MRVLIEHIRRFAGLYPVWYWVVILSFCAVSVFVNYQLGLQAYIDSLSGIKEYFAYMLLYAVHTCFAYFMYSLHIRDFSLWRNMGFIIMLLLGFAVFAGRAVLWQHSILIESCSMEGQIGINRIVYNDLFRILYVFIPIGIIWFFADRTRMPFYGFSAEHHQSGKYLILLACMVPLIAGASMLSDFLDYYPRFRKLLAYGSGWNDVVLYELFYGLDFTSIELFFRGFMVVAFIRYAGIHAILPMASFYLCIHYGKPLGEAVSSFFGGSILGIIAFYSRSIYGGIMVHVGIAWLMELGAWIGNALRGSWPY